MVTADMFCGVEAHMTAIHARCVECLPVAERHLWLHFIMLLLLLLWVCCRDRLDHLMLLRLLCNAIHSCCSAYLHASNHMSAKRPETAAGCCPDKPKHLAGCKILAMPIAQRQRQQLHSAQAR
jgi:hypothetical protein